VELGEGIQAKCRLTAANADRPAADARGSNTNAEKADLSSLSSMLQARWKASAPTSAAKPEAIRPGQILKFRIVKLDPAAKTLELELSE
jgi:small subunit ribosomal protein S1